MAKLIGYLAVLVLLCHSLVAFEQSKDCGVSVGCYSDCGSGDCSYEVTWKDTGTKVEFTMKASIPSLSSTGNWIALGLSDDKHMGSDTVFECVTDMNDFFVRRSWNSGYSNRDVSTETWITDTFGNYTNGVLLCSFSADTNNGIVDFGTDWYILFGKGVFENNKKKKHESKPDISSAKADFQNFVALTAAGQNIMLKLHGIMMIAAWILCASIGVVVARYYKPVWLEEKLLGEKVWFTIHRSIMVFAVLFCIAGFTIIFVDRGTFKEVESDSDVKKAHPFLGLIIMCLAVIQPVMAVLRPHPGDKHRAIFNWAHWGVGVLLHLLAVLNIVIGVLLDAMEMPVWVAYVVVAYAAYQILIELFLEIYDCAASGKNRSTAYEMRENGSLEKNDPDENSRYSFKKIVLAAHTLIIFAFAAVLIIFVALDLSDEK